MRRCHLLPVVAASCRSLIRLTGGARRYHSSGSGVENAVKTSGFRFSTPNFSVDNANGVDANELVGDMVTSPVTKLNFVMDMYGPWLVLTEDIQGELFVDHDRMVYLRPANGLGFGVGRIDVGDSCPSGIVFALHLESYTYPMTSTAPPSAPTVLEVTGVVKRVRSASSDYTTLTLVASWRKKDGTSGGFNAAKLSPWNPATNTPPWKPKEELLHIFQQVFPKPLSLTSHIKRMQQTRAASSSSSLPHHLSLEAYRVGEIADVYYIPDYISEEEEQQILHLVRDTPKELKTNLTKRTVQEWGCTMCETCNKSFLSDRNMPPWVEACTDMQLYDGIFTPSTFPNSVRVHEYYPSDGIAPHCDGPIYVPLVSILSAGSPCVMFFYSRREPYEQPMEHYNDTFRFDGEIPSQRPLQSVVLEPRSLLLFRGDAYHYHPHGTSDRNVDLLTPEAAGKVVNRHLLKEKDIMEVEKGYRVSITTRNLLPRCNHEPTRVEYGMKRAWFVYNQLPVPEPLMTPSPHLPSVKTIEEAKTAIPVEKPMPEKTTVMTEVATKVNSMELEKKLDKVLAQQSAISQHLGEVRELLVAEATFRREVSTVLGHLSSTVLEIESKLDNIMEENDKTGNTD